MGDGGIGEWLHADDAGLLAEFEGTGVSLWGGLLGLDCCLLLRLPQGFFDRAGCEV